VRQGQMSGAYRLIEVLKRLHPRFLFEESHGQLVDAFWASQDLGEPDRDPFTGEVARCESCEIERGGCI
jgi:hypothetical protein